MKQFSRPEVDSGFWLYLILLLIVGQSANYLLSFVWRVRLFVCSLSFLFFETDQRSCLTLKLLTAIPGILLKAVTVNEPKYLQASLHRCAFSWKTCSAFHKCYCPCIRYALKDLDWMRCVMWISGGEPFKYILCNICRKFVTPSVSHFCNSIYDTFWENGARRCAAVVQAGKCRHNLGSRRKTENSNKPEVEQLKISSSAEIRTKSKTPEKWLKFLIHSNGIAPTWTISTELHASKGKGRLVTTFVPV